MVKGVIKEIREELFNKSDAKYRDFQAKLIPTVKPESIIGVRTPELRKMAKVYAKNVNIDAFLNDLPHNYFDENQLHAFILSELKDYNTCVSSLERFLPYIDNWATCDQLSPKILKKNRDKLHDKISIWLDSGKTYTVRFAIGMIMEHYLDTDFRPDYLERVSRIVSDEYYINMMIAWYFATALAKQYDDTVPYIENKRLPLWVHNKTIQKARESFRISPEMKEELYQLRVIS